MTPVFAQNIVSRPLSPDAMKFLLLREDVMDHWEQSARAILAGAESVSSPVLTNTLPAFYEKIAETLCPNHPRADATSSNNCALAHGGERARMTPFQPDQIVHEYQLLRNSIAQISRDRLNLTDKDWEVIDLSLQSATREALSAFMSVSEELRGRAAATLAHDMRTPLSVIVNGAQIISMASDEPIALRAVTAITSSAQRLETMLVELVDALTFQRPSGLRLDLSQFDISKLIKESCKQYEYGDGFNRKLDVVGESIIGYWDYNSILRSLENIINNAIKYGKDDIITISTSQSRGRLMLSVHNKGSVIPKERQQSIFEYLYRENTVAVFSWGIGLPYIKHIAEAHGGTVAVDSSIENGTTFLVDIPIDCRPYSTHSG